MLLGIPEGSPEVGVSKENILKGRVHQFNFDIEILNDAPQ